MRSSKTYGLAIKAIENKCKLKGHYKDNVVAVNGTVVQMGSVEVDGKELTLKIGDPIEVEHSSQGELSETKEGKGV